MSIFEYDQRGSHVITAQPWDGILRNQVLEQILHYLSVIFALLECLSNYIYHALVILYIILPDTITPHQNELIRLPTLELTHIRLTRYHLLLVAQIFVALVVEVTQTTRQIEATIHPPHRYHSACFFYTSLFYGWLWFVILREGHGFALPAQNRPGVARIRNIEGTGGDQ